jgi:hypothetical protein
LVSLDGDHALGARHLNSSIDNMDDYHEFHEEMPLKDAVVTDVEAGHFERQHLSVLVVSCLTGYLKINSSNGSG